MQQQFVPLIDCANLSYESCGELLTKAYTREFAVLFLSSTRPISNQNESLQAVVWAASISDVRK